MMQFNFLQGSQLSYDPPLSVIILLFLFFLHQDCSHYVTGHAINIIQLENREPFH